MERYLSQATDLVDLERRQKDWDSRIRKQMNLGQHQY